MFWVHNKLYPKNVIKKKIQGGATQNFEGAKAHLALPTIQRL